MRRWSAPVVVHVAGLAAGFVTILLVGWDQWFFGDDWSVLVPRNDGNLLSPHVGHWNLGPALIFQAIRDVFGMSSYFPFLVPAVLAHLTVVHLSWRLLRRIGAGDWPATLAGLLLTVLGAAAENLLWAFQVGFMGGLAFGLAVVLLLDGRPLRARVAVSAGALAVVAPMFSSTALPVLAAAGIVAVLRHGLPRAFAVLGPAAAIYLAWYVGFAWGQPGSGLGVSGADDILPALLFATAMVAAGLGRALPFIGLGVIPAAGTLGWLVATVRRQGAGRAAPAYAMAVGALLFTGLTAVSRVGSGLSAAGAQRYAYVTIVLLLPALVLATLALVRRFRLLRVPVVGIVGALVLFNIALLVVEAGVQAEREAVSRARIEAALELLASDPGSMSDHDLVDPEWAPDLSVADLRDLVDREILAINPTWPREP